MNLVQMTPRRPYILRAFYDWLLDNQMTPHIVVNALYPEVMVPIEFVRDGQIVLNIAPQAVGQFKMTNEVVAFNARFGGIPREVYIPMGAVLAIYARENGAGTMFEPEPIYEEESQLQQQLETVTDGCKSKSIMQLVDNDSAELEPEPSDDDPPPSPPKGRPFLHVVK